MPWWKLSALDVWVTDTTYSPYTFSVSQFAVVETTYVPTADVFYVTDLDVTASPYPEKCFVSNLDVNYTVNVTRPVCSSMEEFLANTKGYRFGFNGQEKEYMEIGNDDIYTADFWEYDGRTARRWNQDPVIKPWNSSYQCLSNSPILMIDPNGDDDFVSKADGTIERKKTDAKTHSYYFMGEDGKLLHLGTYQIVNKKKDLIKMSGSGIGWVKKDKNQKNFLAGDAAAIFLSVAKTYNDQTGYKIFVTQFSTNDGGHSGHPGPGDWIDLKYADTKGGYSNSNDDDYSKELSQTIVDLFRHFGYDSGSRRNKSKYDIITGTENGKRALKGTEYVSGHVSHIHVGNYGWNHVKVVTEFSTGQLPQNSHKRINPSQPEKDLWGPMRNKKPQYLDSPINLPKSIQNQKPPPPNLG